MAFEENLSHPLRVALEENNLYNWIPEATMHIIHGVADELVPFENAQIAYDTFIANGAENVYFELLPESFGGHQEAAVYCLLIAFNLSEELKIINTKADINLDGIIDILDLVLIVSFIVNPEAPSSFEFWSSDLNSDLVINILDIVATVNLIIDS